MKNEQIINSLYDKVKGNVETAKSEEILGVILPLTYGNEKDTQSLQNLLKSEKSKESFLQGLDEVIEGDIKDTKPEETVHEDDEIDELLAQYFKDNAVEIDLSSTRTEQSREGDSLSDKKSNDDIDYSSLTDSIEDSQNSSSVTSDLYNLGEFINFSRNQNEATIVSVGDTFNLLENLAKNDLEKSPQKEDNEEEQEV